MTLILLEPSLTHLPALRGALERGWSFSPRGPEALLEESARDPEGFVAEQSDREGRLTTMTFPNGVTVERLPSYHRWLWDGEFCGSIGFRWRPGTEELPSHVLGHIGYGVVPWKRQRGYATAALAQMLDVIAPEGLRYVEVTASLDNTASRRVIERNGGRLVEEFDHVSVLDGALERLARYRIDL